MTKDEALRMAIEVLNSVIHWGDATTVDIDKTVQACKEALAETQEPVGTTYISRSGYMEVELHRTVDAGVPLYTTPPSRQWVGLSNDDLYKILNDNIGSSSYAIAHAISEALREKNT